MQKLYAKNIFIITMTVIFSLPLGQIEHIMIDTFDIFKGEDPHREFTAEELATKILDNSVTIDDNGDVRVRYVDPLEHPQSFQESPSLVEERPVPIRSGMGLMAQIEQSNNMWHSSLTHDDFERLLNPSLRYFNNYIFRETIKHTLESIVKQHEKLGDRRFKKYLIAKDEVLKLDKEADQYVSYFNARYDANDIVGEVNDGEWICSHKGKYTIIKNGYGKEVCCKCKLPLISRSQYSYRQDIENKETSQTWNKKNKNVKKYF